MTLDAPQTVGPISSSLAIPLVQAGAGDPVLVYNGDVNNVLLLSPFTFPVPMSSIPVQPLTNVVVKDDKKWYGIGQSGSIASVTVAPEGTSMSPSPGQVAAQISNLGLATATNQGTQIGQGTTSNNLLSGASPGALIANAGSTIGHEVAALIASGSSTGTPGGSPLLHGKNVLMNFTGGNTFTLGPGASSFPFTTLTRPGYTIAIMATTPAGTAIPFVQIQTFWKDSTSGGTQVADEFWFIPAVTSGAGSYWHYGKGPTKGDQLTVGITNLDTVQTMTIQLLLIENTQYIARDDWRGMGGGSVNYNQGASPGGSLSTLCLISDRETINAGVDKVYLMPLYAGEVVLQFATSSGTMVVNVGVPVQLPGFSNPVIWQDATTSDVTVYMVLPRAPCYIEFHNTGASNLGITCIMVAHENCT